MRVTILTIGSRGDVQPFLALAEGLRHQGWSVTFATERSFAHVVNAAHHRFCPLPGLPLPPAAARMRRRDRSTLERWFAGMTVDVVNACRSAEVVIHSPLAGPASHFAEAVDIPSFMAALQPLDIRALPWRALKPEVAAWRRRLGLPVRRSRRRPTNVLYGFSSTVVPIDTKWPPGAHVTGYWFGHTQDAGLPSFVEDLAMSRRDPVYLGFGSQTHKTLVDMAVKAARLGRFPAVIGTGDDLPAIALGDDLVAIGEVDHESLFPWMRVAVHHGGAGTTAAALRAGLPSVVVPFGADQPFWAERVHSLGAGPAPLSAAELSPASIVQALMDAQTDTTRAAAHDIGLQIRREDGVTAAVSLIHQMATDNQPATSKSQ